MSLSLHKRSGENEICKKKNKKKYLPFLAGGWSFCGYGSSTLRELLLCAEPTTRVSFCGPALAQIMLCVAFRRDDIMTSVLVLSSMVLSSTAVSVMATPRMRSFLNPLAAKESSVVMSYHIKPWSHLALWQPKGLK